MRAKVAVLALTLAACGGNGTSTTTGGPGTTAGATTTTTGAASTTSPTAATTTTADSGPVALAAVAPYPLQMADFANNPAPDLGVTMALVTGSPLKAIFSASNEFPGDCLGFTIWSPDFLTQFANGHVDITPDGCEGAEGVFGEDEIVIKTGRTIVVELGDLPDGPFIPAFQVLDAGFQSGFYSRPLLIPAEPDDVEELGPGLIVNVLGGENFEIGPDGNWTVVEFPPAQPGVCEPAGGVVCLNEGRFRVEATFTQSGATEPAALITSQDDTGYFWFFDVDNVDLIVRVLNGCSINNHYWVVADSPTGLTDVVDFNLTIEETAGGQIKFYGEDHLLDSQAFDCFDP